MGCVSASARCPVLPVTPPKAARSAFLLADRPIHEPRFPYHVLSRKRSPGSGVVAVHCIVSHHHVVIARHQELLVIIGKKWRQGMWKVLAGDGVIQVSGELAVTGGRIWIKRVHSLEVRRR